MRKVCVGWDLKTNDKNYINYLCNMLFEVLVLALQINRLRIRNFKSIKNVMLDCKRINVFIGEPNTGKSNILEAIGLLSYPSRFAVEKLRSFVRFETLIDLFYDRDIGEKIHIQFDGCDFRLSLKEEKFVGELTFPSDFINKRARDLSAFYENTVFVLDYEGNFKAGSVIGDSADILNSFKYYQFEKRLDFPDRTTNFLLPPNGKNLLHILLTQKELKMLISSLYKKYGYRLVFKPAEGKMEVQKEQDDIVISIPYSLSSETLQRITFYLAAIYSNNESIITFEEPEAHAFPYYMKYLAERVGLERKNQYFIVTHNPYFLMSLIEKAPENELAAFGTYFEDYQTKVKLLSSEALEKAFSMGSDFFLNLNRFFEGTE